jgi:octaprenyl-diphosphate synthase
LIETIRQPVAAEFQAVNALIVEQLASDVDMVENVGHYIVNAGGKRLRPLIALLAAQALGECSKAHIQFAAVVEFIHTATLLHDDVVDLSTLRRGRPTANAEFGNASSVLVGDFLYTRAFQLMVQLDSMPLLKHMAETTNTIAAGEVLQLMRAGDPTTTVDQYLDVIHRKTAVLFSAASCGAAMLSRSGEAIESAMAAFGLHTGIAFQMIDDVLDYDGDPAVTGKHVGDDLREGKATLPLIHTLNEGADADRSLIFSALQNRDETQIDAVLAMVARSGGIEFTRDAAAAHQAKALDALECLESSAAKDSLIRIAELAIKRVA